MVGRDPEAGCPQAIEIGAYILGALEPAEQEAFERHLRGCSRCQRNLESLQRSVEIVAGAVERRQAPAELKRRIMAAVEAEAGPRPARRPLSVRRPAFVQLGFAGAFAALAAALFIAFGGGTTRRTVTVRESAGRRGVVATYAASVSPRLGGATVVVERVGDQGALVAYNLPAPPAGKVYELWVAGSRGEPQPAGLFRPAGSVSRVPIERALLGVNKVMVTVEPRGGTLRPTSAPLVIATL